MAIRSKGAIKPWSKPPRKPYVCPVRQGVTISWLAQPESNIMPVRIKIEKKTALCLVKDFIIEDLENIDLIIISMICLQYDSMNTSL